MAQQQAIYDDGLKQNPPRNTVEFAHYLLKAVSCNSENKWNITLPIERFGMPRQPSFGEGCASCGVGVILAVYDFIDNPADNRIPKLHWHFPGKTSPDNSLSLYTMEMNNIIIIVYCLHFIYLYVRSK